MEEIINKIKKMNVSTIVIIVFLIIIIIINLTSGTGKKNNNNKIVTFNYTKENTTDIYAIINALQAKLNKLQKEINQKQTLNFLGGLWKFKGKIKSKRLLPDGSMIITTKDGKKFLVHPDGTVQEIKNYKVNPDGTISITAENGKIITVKTKHTQHFSNKKKNNSVFSGIKKIPNNISEIVDENGNRYFKDKNGNWYMITPDGKKIKLGKNLKIDSKGDIVFNGKKLGKLYSMKTKYGIMLDKNGNIYQAVEEAEGKNANKLSAISNKLNLLSKKHGGIVDEKFLSDGSVLVTTADGKKFLVHHPDGTVQEIKSYKVNPDGTVFVKIIKNKKLVSQLNPNDFLISNILNKHGKLINVNIDKNGNLLLIPYDKTKFYISNGNVYKVLNFFKKPKLNYIKVICKNKIFDMYYGLENIELNKRLKSEKSFIDFHELENNSVLFTTEKKNKYLITFKGKVIPLYNYKINPDGTVIITESSELKMDLSGNNTELKTLLRKGKKIVDEKVLADGSILVTTADGKKFLVHPDGTVQEIKNYKVNPDGTVSIVDKNGKLKTLKGPKFLKKIFVDKNGKKYLLDENGNKHYIKNGYIDQNGNLVYTDLNGNVHVLKNTGEKVILKTTPNNKHEVVGIGDIVDVNGKKMLIIKKIFYKNSGYPVEYLITFGNLEYSVKNNNVYLNNTKLGKGFIYYLKNDKFVVLFDNNKKIIDKSKVKFYKIMPLYYTNQNNNLIFKIVRNNIYIIHSNGEIEKLKNAIYKIKNNKLIISFLGIKNTKDYLIKNNVVFPMYITKDLKLLELPYSYYIFDKTNLIYKIFIENIKPEYYNINNIKLVNNLGIKILGLYQNKQPIQFSDNLKYLEYNNLYYHNSLLENKFDKYINKLTKKVYGYQINNVLFANAEGNVIEVTPGGYFIIPENKLFVQNKEVYTKSYFKEIDINNIEEIKPEICLKNKGVIVKLNGEYYLLKDNNITSIGKGKLEVIGNDVLLSGIELGKTCKYNFSVEDGYIMKPVITTKEVKNINELNNILNRYFAILDYGVKVYFENGGMVFYNDKLDVVYVNPDASIKNLGKGKIILNKQNRYVYFVNNNGEYIFLGIMKSRIIENNLLVITTNGKYYINKNTIFQVLKNNVLNNLTLAPDLENGFLFGFNRQRIFNLGKILEIYKANLTGKNIKILNNGINYLINNPEGNAGQIQIQTGMNTSGRISKNLVIENGMVFKIKNGKKILLGKLNTAGRKFIVVKDKKTNKNIVIDKNGNVITFIKKTDGQIIMKKNGKRFIPSINSGIKIKNGKVYIDGHLIKNLKFVNEYRKNRNASIRLLSPQEYENLFVQEIAKKKKIIENKPKFNIGNNIKKKNYFNNNTESQENPATYRYEVITSNTAIKKNEELFLNNNNKPIIINADTGEIASNINSIISNKYFLIPGIKIPVTLVGGSLAPLTQLASSDMEGTTENPVANFIPNSFFVITKNITLPSGKVVPMNRGIIVAKPIPTTAQRMFYQCKTIYFYDQNTNRWYEGQAAGQIISAVDNVPGLPGILIDTRNKYIAKAAIYSILEGISKFINNVHSPLDAMQNATQTNITPPSVGGTLGTTLLGGAAGQLKDLSNLFMAIIKSQVPYLAVQNGEKGYFITDNVIRFSTLNLGN